MAADLSVIADVRLPDPDGVEHRIGDYWSEQPLVAVWLRHYG